MTRSLPGSSTTSTTRTYNKEWASSPQTKSSSRTRDRRPSSTHGPRARKHFSRPLLPPSRRWGGSESKPGLRETFAAIAPSSINWKEKKQNKTKQGCFILFKLQNCIHSWGSIMRMWSLKKRHLIPNWIKLDASVMKWGCIRKKLHNFYCPFFLFFFFNCKSHPMTPRVLNIATKKVKEKRKSSFALLQRHEGVIK